MEKAGTASTKGRASKVRAITVPAAVGVLLFAANSLLLGLLSASNPLIAQLIYGRGSWWLDESLIVKAAYVGVIAPFAEELLFRRLLFNHFIRRGKANFGLALSSIMFGLWHTLFGWGILKALDMAIVGLVFGLAYKKWGFKGALLSHYANNIAAVLAMAAA